MAKRAKAAPSASVPTIIDCCESPDIWGPWFTGPSWGPWLTFLKVVYGIQLDAAELEIFRQCTARNFPAPEGYIDISLICGRRAGKSLILAILACYNACFRDFRPFLQKNELATAMVIAADRRQAKQVFGYARGLLSVPLLANLIVRETADTIELSNQVALAIETASHRTLRGRTVCCGIGDEVAHFRTDDGAATNDVEIFQALRPAMATIPQAMLLKGSSPYSPVGVLHGDYEGHYGVEDSKTLVWKAPTWVMNPSVSQDFLDAEREKDPVSFEAEYGANFRKDVAGWLDRATITAAIDNDVIVRPPNTVNNSYISFCDPSGGVRDSFTCAVAHAEGGTAVLDCLVEIPAPLNPSQACDQIAGVLKSYGLSETTGDRYGAQWVVDAMASRGITYKHSERDRSSIYNNVLPLFNSGCVRLLDNKRLVNQLASLERKTGPSGKDRVDHPAGQKDDAANSAAGALVLATSKSNRATLLFDSVATTGSGRSQHMQFGFG